ncbi:hypothetical protein ACSS6W_001955 [Trichoderma asperelloides]|uniref:Uncharacterized oxidoreductase MexAM1_META1p0182 n=2 Tax=Trichoderma asperellum TaxID=101201 RepID=A0A6V8QP22_TRIAP|nr:hypothetical protein M441DRAFT_67330 [Trichoderma asperellum CBS 433.97]KAH8130587.1 hypothetical protein LI328DRAFT_161607 [Trichoderma asperelloides]PTB43587.1 hypothetical protein M441DRAFT_67330 [Trichoderma asperellum CBS 433.97]UKZ86310.1 hypothetical protein TrAFT101_002146 [Trichoderma asperellum]GFP54261.1 uncharacterized oxidoreductase MexAM1_META1p0182 [Trichoderma asperellum]
MSTVDSLSLAGKTAIVTGSGKENGIGAAIALALARNGARVAINYVSEATAPRAAKVAASIEAVGGKGSAAIIQQDVTTPEGTKKLVAETIKAFGVDRIDILVNNAAWAAREPVLTTTQENVQRTFDTCVLGPLYLIQATVPYMPQGGRIINVGSVASKLGIEPVYGAAKAAMDALTFSLARDLGSDGKRITINTVMPGPVLTDSLPPTPEFEMLKDGLLNMTRAERRFGTVEDIADSVLLLANEKSRWITGESISVSGGIVGN